MTIDQRMISKSAYEDILKDNIKGVLFRVYEDLSEMHLDSKTVHLADLIEFTYSDLFIDQKDFLIEESINRKDYEELDMTKEEYIVACYTGSIEDESITPHIEQGMLRTIIMELADKNKLFLQHPDFTFVHQPLLEVW